MVHFFRFFSIATVILGLNGAQGQPIPSAPDETTTSNIQSSTSASQSTLGMQLEVLSDETRRRFRIAPSVSRGIIVVRVDPTSGAASKGIVSGDVIQDINQEPVNSLAEVVQRKNEVKSLGRISLLLLVADNQGRPRFVAIPMDFVPNSIRQPPVASESIASHDDAPPQAAPKEADGGAAPYRLMIGNKIQSVGHIASSKSICDIFERKIFNNPLKDLNRYKYSPPVPVFVFTRDVDKNRFMSGWIRERIKKAFSLNLAFVSNWNPVDKKIINDNFTDCLRTIWNVNKDKYNVINSLVMGNEINYETACFQQKYKSTLKIRDDGQKYEEKTPIGGEPKCIAFDAVYTDVRYEFLIMLTLDEAHPVLNTVLNDVEEDVQPNIDYLRNAELKRQNELNDFQVATIKQNESYEANVKSMSPIIMGIVLYMIACGFFVLPIVRPQMLHWYQSQIWVYQAPNNMGGLVDLIYKRVGLRLSFELIVFVVSCVFGGLGGWYFKLRRKRTEAQQAQ